MLNFTTPFTRHRLVVRKRIRSQWSISTIICICTIAYKYYITYSSVCPFNGTVYNAIFFKLPPTVDFSLFKRDFVWQY